MSDTRAVRKINLSAVSSDSGGYNPLEATRDGSLFTADWKQRYIMAGRGYHVTVGAFSTGIVGGGDGTIIDLDQPEAGVAIPNGTAIIPIRVSVQCHVPLLATDADEAEILVAVDRATALAFDGTWATAETIFNLRTDNPNASNCTSKSACTADTTDPVLGIELARKVVTGDVNGTPGFAAFWTDLNMVYEPLTPPIIMGPASLIVYWGGTVAVTGFAQIQWIEFAETDFA